MLSAPLPGLSNSQRIGPSFAVPPTRRPCRSPAMLPPTVPRFASCLLTSHHPRAPALLTAQRLACQSRALASSLRPPEVRHPWDHRLTSLLVLCLLCHGSGSVSLFFPSFGLSEPQAFLSWHSSCCSATCLRPRPAPLHSAPRSVFPLHVSRYPVRRSATPLRPPLFLSSAALPIFRRAHAPNQSYLPPY